METKNAVEREKVLALIAEIREAIGAHPGLVSASEAATAEAAAITDGISRLRGSIGNRETEIASSATAPLPEEPFPEEQEMARLERHLRIVRERARIQESTVAANVATLSDLRARLRSAWQDFAIATCKEQRARYRAAGIALRELYIEQMAYLRLFGNIKAIPEAGGALVLDPETGAPLLSSGFLDIDKAFQGFSNNQFEAARVLCSEVDGVIRAQ